MSAYRQFAIISGTAFVAISVYFFLRRKKEVNVHNIDNQVEEVKEDLESHVRRTSLVDDYSSRDFVAEETDEAESENIISGPERHKDESLVEWIDRQLREAEERKKCKELKQQSTT